jgi:hypothetical protein
LALVGFDGTRDDSFLRVFHEIAKEDKGKELILEGFRSPLPVNAKDVEVNLLHVIFLFERGPYWEGVFQN